MDEVLNRAEPWAFTLAQHNAPLFLYATAFVWASARCYMRPTRQAFLMVYGFLVLTVAFEYRKHGMDMIRDTTNYLFSVENNPGLRHISQTLLLGALPVALYVIGFALLAVSLLQRHGDRA